MDNVDNNDKMDNLDNLDIVILSKEEAAIMLVASCALGSFFDGMGDFFKDYTATLHVLGGLEKLSEVISKLNEDFGMENYFDALYQKLAEEMGYDGFGEDLS